MAFYDYNFVLDSLATEIEIYAEMAEKSPHERFIEKLNLQLDEIEKEKRERKGDKNE